jgi:hypothetical protein
MTVPTEQNHHVGKPPAAGCVMDASVALGRLYTLLSWCVCLSCLYVPAPISCSTAAYAQVSSRLLLSCAPLVCPLLLWHTPCRTRTHDPHMMCAPLLYSFFTLCSLGPPPSPALPL